MSRPRVSVIISCFNYERFVAAAIESALQQDGAGSEVVVVDDGSEDGSAAVIAAFGDRVTAISKANGGQASALNAGFAASTGDVVIFLDADDVLLPGAVLAAARALSDPSVAKAHWSLPVIDAHGRRTGGVQDPELAEGDLRRHVLCDGPLSDMTMPSPPMSGNAFPRWFLERVMPIPQRLYRSAADEYLFGLAPAFGAVVRLEPRSLYRVHADNDHARWSFERMLAFQLDHHDVVFQRAAAALREEGLDADVERWRRASWWLRVARVVGAIDATVPPGADLVLIDEDSLGIAPGLRGRRVAPFPQAEGLFAGSPASDAEALAELAGVAPEWVVITWTAFWWLQEYPRFAGALRDRYSLLREDPDVIVFGPDVR